MATEEVEVKYKNKLFRIFSDICAFMAGKSCIGCGRCLGVLLDSQTCDVLRQISADIVISTGSVVASINKIFSSYVGAKSAIILRPNLPLGKFDVAIIPEHDRVISKNTVTIKGALFYPSDVEEKVKKCRDFFKLSSVQKISFFV